MQQIFFFFTIWSIKGFEFAMVECDVDILSVNMRHRIGNVHVKMGELWRHVVQHSRSISVFVNQIAPLAFIPFNLTISNKSEPFYISLSLRVRLFSASHLEQVNRTCDQIFKRRLSLVSLRLEYTVTVDSSSKLFSTNISNIRETVRKASFFPFEWQWLNSCCRSEHCRFLFESLMHKKCPKCVLFTCKLLTRTRNGKLQPGVEFGWALLALSKYAVKLRCIYNSNSNHPERMKNGLPFDNEIVVLLIHLDGCSVQAPVVSLAVHGINIRWARFRKFQKQMFAFI